MGGEWVSVGIRYKKKKGLEGCPVPAAASVRPLFLAFHTLTRNGFAGSSRSHDRVT